MLPRVLGAFDAGVLIGIGAILLDDMDDRPEWNPWIGCLFVIPTARSVGVGSTLVQFLIAEACQLRLEKLFGFCQPSLVPFYESFGFQSIETRVFEGELQQTIVLDFYRPCLEP